MSELRNCRKCGKMFTYTGKSAFCQACVRREEEDYQKVKEYLYDNPGASMNEVSSVTGVSVEKIMRFLREGRLEIVEGSNIVLECERCKRSIRTGRFCNDCMKGIEGELESAAKEISASIEQLKSTNPDRGLKKDVRNEIRYLNKK